MELWLDIAILHYYHKVGMLDIDLIAHYCYHAVI